MPLPLFEDPISLNFQNYHFKIRGWIPSSGRSVSKFDTFITKFSKSLALRTEKVFMQDEKVAFIRLISTKDSIPLKDGIKRLCRHITNPENRIHIDRVTTRSLFGISPANNETLICWVEALFKRALQNGPQYLTKIELTETDHIPDWAIVLSFAMIAGINIPGYQVTKLEETNDADNQKDEFNTRMIRLFGSDGIKEGSNFLQHIIQQNKDAPDLTQLRLSYSRIMNEVEDSVENTLNRIKQIQANTHCSKKDLSRSCIQAVIACHNTTLLAAQAMLTDGDILETYCTARLEETEKISFMQSIAAVSFITNAAMACQVVAAPWSWAAVGTWFTAGAWPTVLTVTNPAGLVVSAVGLAILGISSFKESQRKREILRHQNCENQIPIIDRQDMADIKVDASILRYSIVYLDSEKSANAVDRCLEYAGNEELLHFWQEFVKKDEPKRTQRKIERHRKFAATKESKKNNDQSSAQRQVSRCIKELTTAQVHQLRACLYRFKETGTLDMSDSEEPSSEDSL